MRDKQIARDISYAHSAQTRGGRAVIRLMENATGRVGLIRRAAGYQDDIARGRDFWQVMVDRYGLRLEVIGGSLDNIPQDGPVIAIANHPYGILDGLMLGHLLSQTRGDFRILAHRVFSNAPDLNRVILPIDFAESKEAVRLNLTTRKTALDYLGQGGCIGIFPGGTVATAATPFGAPMDPGWRSFTARMIAKSGAQVVPIYFDGHTSRLFQIASHLHTTLRMGLLIKEFRKRVDTPVRIAVGQPIPPHQIAAHAADTRGLMDFLRKATYGLSPDPVKSFEYGYEFEEKHRSGGQPRRY
ncbi:lysophospholipid acyltransferase family protein [Tropicibacter naphthalenivorans]|uniref:2-acyl-glycerophospho-ethanolamine acyltransferase n=1 Tax=Tropicibacter naphthalenivorans TaxID=441103 RepID=A0A0N7LZ97_9RHOB|nr:lysophospholipid acyltransferase family protein [Tropicibacter naphthalenivorans]CUH77057.1 2-acyl-glycerophospho-ethanolamine acyltransferase [Tropicibacter naphthalenivorans]SMC61185.1 Putative hemolysin [Tropicibacter naphthalenivorans]